MCGTSSIVRWLGRICVVDGGAAAADSRARLLLAVLPVALGGGQADRGHQSEHDDDEHSGGERVVGGDAGNGRERVAPRNANRVLSLRRPIGVVGDREFERIAPLHQCRQTGTLISHDFSS